MPGDGEGRDNREEKRWEVESLNSLMSVDLEGESHGENTTTFKYLSGWRGQAVRQGPSFTETFG